MSAAVPVLSASVQTGQTAWPVKSCGPTCASAVSIGRARSPSQTGAQTMMVS